MHRSPFDLESRLYGPQRIAALVATLAEDGVAPAQTLAGSGLDEAALHAPATRVSYHQIASVCRNAVRLAPDPTVALRAGARVHVTALGMYGYGLLSSPTHAEQVDFSIKYNRAIGPVAGPTAFSRDGDTATYTYEVFISPDPSDDLYRFALEFSYSMVLTIGQDLCGPSFAFSAVHASCPAPAHASAYRKRFGCPVRFNHPTNELRMDAAWIDLPRRLPDAVTHAMVREICQQFLVDSTHSGGVAAVVRRILVEQMPWRFPSIESMASELSMHPRTLRRRLEGEGTTYRHLLSDVRLRLAIEYLHKTRLTTEEISSRLGYSDAANFRHAFARWTGKSPREYRVG